MSNKFLNIVNRLFNRSYRYDDDVTVSTPDEFSLLIKNKRIVDYSKVSDKLQLPFKLGIYHDTYKFLVHGIKKEHAVSNIENVFSSVPDVFQKLELEKNNLINNESGVFKRVFKLFLVENLHFANGKSEYNFCLNLFIRPDGQSFMVVGKTPKGKLKKLKENEGVVKSSNSTEVSWETVDFK